MMAMNCRRPIREEGKINILIKGKSSWVRIVHARDLFPFQKKGIVNEFFEENLLNKSNNNMFFFFDALIFFYNNIVLKMPSSLF